MEVRGCTLNNTETMQAFLYTDVPTIWLHIDPLCLLYDPYFQFSFFAFELVCRY